MNYPFTIRDTWEGVEVPFRVLEESREVACHLNNDLEIVYCNPACDEFALANHGDSAVFESVRNTSVMAVVPKDLREFYEAVFKSAQSGIVEFDYECSSPQVLRHFRMQVIPNNLLGGLTVLNSLIVEEPINSARTPDSSDYEYARESGLIEMCSHCRRSHRIRPQEHWDWVPAHLDRSLRNVSHGLCAVCRAYFYGQQK